MKPLLAVLLLVAAIATLVVISRTTPPESTEGPDRRTNRPPDSMPGSAETDVGGPPSDGPVEVKGEPRGGRIQGTIRGPAGNPVAGARVRARFASERWERRLIAGEIELPRAFFSSDDRGRFEVWGLRHGKHLLVVVAEGYRTHVRTGLDVLEGAPTTADVALEIGKTIRGRVVDSDGRGVVASVRVEEPDGRILRLLELEPRFRAEDGSFTLAGLGTQPVAVVAEVEDWVAITVNDVEPGTDDLLIRLGRPAVVAGRVVAAKTGDPVARVRVARDGMTTFGETDDAGRFRFELMPPGRHLLHTEHDEYARAEFELDLAEGAVVEDVEILLHPGSALTGVVIRAADGGPVPGAAVDVDGRGQEEFTDSDGRFEVARVAPGRHVVLVRAAGFAPRRNADVELPLRAPLRIALTEGGSIRGTVRDAEGSPIPGAWVWRAPPSNMNEGDPGEADENGVFRFEHVAPGPHVVFHVRVGGGLDFEMRQVAVVEGRETLVDFGRKVKRRKVVLTGRILDRGKPAALRAIVLVPVSGGDRGFKLAMSDLAGRFRVAELDPGRYRVMISDMTGTNVDVLPAVDVSGDGEISRDVSLSEARIAGRILRRKDREPVAKARVVIVDPARINRIGRSVAEVMDLFRGQTRSRSDGSFEFANAPEGGHLILVAADGLAPAFVEDVVAATEEVEPVEVLLERGDELTVEVTDADGAPVAGAAIFLADDRGRYVMIGETEPRTGRDGRVVLRLIPGTYRFHVQADGHAPADRPVVLQGDRLVAFRLGTGGHVGVHVTDAAGPISGAVVSAFREDGTEILRRFTIEDFYRPPPPPITGEDGRHVASNLPAGKVRIRVRAPGGRTADAWVEVVTGERTDVSIPIE